MRLLQRVIKYIKCLRCVPRTRRFADDPPLSLPLEVNPGLAKGPSLRKAGSPPGK